MPDIFNAQSAEMAKKAKAFCGVFAFLFAPFAIFALKNTC
jgi:hypothetical protein